MKYMNIGLIGAGFIGKAHSVAFDTVPVNFWPMPVVPRKLIVAHPDKEKAKAAANNLGYENWTTKFEDIISDDRVDIVDICTPNYLHKELAIAAARSGKHIICEKPLALNSKEAKEMYEEAEHNGIKHMVGFNYRHIPAIAFAKELIENGKLGTIYDFNGSYILDWAANPNTPLYWFLQASKAGAGSIANVGSHIIDLARFLVGDLKKVTALTHTFIKERLILTQETAKMWQESKDKKNSSKEVVKNDDICKVIAEFSNGARGNIITSRVASGRKNHLSFEINGSKGSLYFNWGNSSEIQYYSTEDPETESGFKIIRVGHKHALGEYLLPEGLHIGYYDSIAIEIYKLIMGIIENKPIQPNFYDGWKVCEIVDAILESSNKSKWVDCGS